MLGDAWEDLGVLNPAPTGVECFVYLGNGIVLAGTVSTFGGGLWYKSTDYGQSWTDMGSTPGAETSVMALVNCENGVVVAGMGVGDSDVERSTDWGDSFVFIKELSVWLRACNSGTYCGNNIVLIGTNGSKWTGHNAEVFRSGTGGLTWDAGQIISTTAFDVCEALQYLENGIVVAGTLYGEIARSIDNGVSWALAVIDIGDVNDRVYDFAYLGGGVVLLCSHHGYIWKSTDYGLNWTNIASLGVSLSELEYAGNNMLFAAGADGHVYRSLDGGYNWTDPGLILPGITDALRSLHYFASETEQVLVAGYAGLAGDARIARTTEAIPQLRAPTNLLCEQTENPTDVTDPQPEFSAIHHFGVEG